MVAEDVSGGNTADIRVQWGASDELPLFNRSLCAVSRFDGTAWVTGSFASATGADSFSSTVTAVNAFREFSVMDNLLNLNTSVEGSGARDSTVPQLFPQPADQVLHMKAADGQIMTSVRLLDASGRVALQPSNFSTDRGTLDVSTLAPGMYVVEWNDALQGNGRAPVIISR